MDNEEEVCGKCGGPMENGVCEDCEEEEEDEE